MKCARCFYLDRRLGVSAPSGPPFTINSAVDTLLKREFDSYRAKGTPHPYMIKAGIDAVPANHPMLDDWRENFKGVRYLHPDTNLLVTGAIDDLWLGRDEKHIVADYKATAKSSEVSLDADWQIAYKRQMEIYQWLLRRNELEVNDTGWFVYCNGRLNAATFDGHVTFKVSMLPYSGDDSWVEPVLISIRKTLESDAVPEPNKNCDYCTYRADAVAAENS